MVRESKESIVDEKGKGDKRVRWLYSFGEVVYTFGVGVGGGGKENQ